MFVPKKLRQHYKYEDRKWKAKKQFETLEEAEKEGNNAYECKICNKYHIGRLVKTVKR